MPNARHAHQLAKIAKETLSLRDLVRRTDIRRHHLVADLGLIELACQVITHSTNSALIYGMNEADGVHTTVRAAFEAGQDLSFLVHAGDYDHFGCRLQVAEIIDRARAVQLAKEFDSARGFDPDGPDVDEDARFEADIATWQKHRPEARDIYMKAVGAVRADRARRRYHWSGLTRDQMVARITERNRIEWLPTWNRAMYTFLSLGAHPTAGAGPNDVDIPDIGNVSFLARDEQESALVAEAASDCVVYSLRITRIALALAFVMEAEMESIIGEVDDWDV
jgi:hypothetical protein